MTVARLRNYRTDVTTPDDDSPLAMVREYSLPPEMVDRVARLFWTLADPTRVRIVHALTLADLSNTEIAEAVGLSDDGVKYHLKLLSDNGKIRRVGSTKAGHWEVLD